MPFVIGTDHDPGPALAQYAAQAGAARGEREARNEVFGQNMELAKFAMSAVGMGLDNNARDRGLDQRQQAIDNQSSQFDREQTQQDYQFQQLYSPDGLRAQSDEQQYDHKFDMEQAAAGRPTSAQIREISNLDNQIFELEQIAKDPTSSFNDKYHLDPQQAQAALNQLRERKKALPRLPSNRADSAVNDNIVMKEFTLPDGSKTQIPMTVDRNGVPTAVNLPSEYWKQQFPDKSKEIAAQQKRDELEFKRQNSVFASNQDRIDGALKSRMNSINQQIDGLQKQRQKFIDQSMNEKTTPEDKLAYLERSNNIQRQIDVLNQSINTVTQQHDFEIQQLNNAFDSINGGAMQPTQTPIGPQGSPTMNEANQGRITTGVGGVPNLANRMITPEAIEKEKIRSFAEKYRSTIPPDALPGIEDDLTTLSDKVENAKTPGERNKAQTELDFYLQNIPSMFQQNAQ